MMQALASRTSALLLATIGVTLASMIVTFGGSLAVLGLIQIASTSSYASVQATSAPLRFVNWTASPSSGRARNP